MPDAHYEILNGPLLAQHEVRELRDEKHSGEHLRQDDVEPDIEKRESECGAGERRPALRDAQFRSRGAQPDRRDIFSDCGHTSGEGERNNVDSPSAQQTPSMGQSARSASIGFTRAARRAGIQLASSAKRNSVAVAPPRTSGSVGATSNKKDR